MKKLLFLLLLLTNILISQAQESEITTYYLIRHAEKERSDATHKNPNLTEKGEMRAKNWGVVFENVDFDLIYSTNYNRTIQTATPTSINKNLEIKFYNPRELYNEDFKNKTKHKTVLIVGHSNSTPLFVNKIIGKEKYVEIEDTNNSNLYIVTIINKSIIDSQLKINHNL